MALEFDAETEATLDQLARFLGEGDRAAAARPPSTPSL